MRADPDEIDEAIGDWLRHESDPALRRLVDLGPAALSRAIEMYYGGAAAPAFQAAQRTRHDRELVDAWAVLQHRLAVEHAELYLAEVTSGRVKIPSALPTLELVILGDIDLPEAVDILLRYRNHAEWLVRYHMVRALGRRRDPRSVEAVRAAASDREPVVRAEAAQWLRLHG